MEYITSRGFDLPTDPTQMETLDWYNMWGKRNFPYHELLVGDTLYWFTATYPLNDLFMETEVVSGQTVIQNTLTKTLSLTTTTTNGDETITTVEKKAASSAASSLVTRVKVIEQLDIPKPTGFNFPRLGWLRVDNNVAISWFSRAQIDDTNILDDIISSPDSSVADQLSELNQKMQNVSPERIDKLVSTTIRKDTKNHKCFKKGCGL